MPEAPSVSFFTRYVLESPLPLTIVLLVGAVVFCVMALRDGRGSMFVVSGALLLLAGGVFGLGSLVVTSGEHAEALTLDFEQRAVAGDVAGSMALFTDGAVLTLNAPTNEALSLEYVRSGIAAVSTRYRIDDNRVSQLRGYTVSSDHAIVHMTCMTDVGGSTTQTQWVLSARRQSDDTWKFDKITWVNVNRQRPSTSWLR